MIELRDLIRRVIATIEKAQWTNKKTCPYTEVLYYRFHWNALLSINSE